jgi:hypothetical protein
LLLNRAIDKVPNAGERYTVEVRLTLFETDIPPQHHWAPGTGKYKILWAKALKADVVGKGIGKAEGASPPGEK